MWTDEEIAAQESDGIPIHHCIDCSVEFDRDYEGIETDGEVRCEGCHAEFLELGR